MADSRMTFGEYLTQWMAERRLTAVALARLTGEKSATSIARLKSDQCTPARCAAFLEQLRQTVDDMTQEEISRFQMGIHVLTLGKKQFDAYLALNEIFLLNKEHQPQRTKLTDELIRLTEADECNIICMQCTDCMIADTMTFLMKNARGRLHIDHYVTFPMLTSTAEFLAHALPALFDSRYRMIELRFATQQPALGLTAQSFMYVQTFVNGDEQCLLMIPCSDGSVLRLSGVNKSGFEACRRLIRQLDCQHIPINTTYRYDNPDDLTHFLLTTTEDFKNHPTYLYSRDFHFTVIPIETLQSAFNRNNSPPQTLANTATELRRLCYQFFVNLRDAKRPVCMLMSRSGIRHFMATGLLNDHFFALRVFTPVERIKVLQNIIRMVKINPNITLRFIRDEASMRLYDFSLVENHRLIITSANATQVGSSRYAMAETYVEICLEDPCFLAQATRYFEEYLLAHHTFSAEESIAFLNEQVVLAKQAL